MYCSPSIQIIMMKGKTVFVLGAGTGDDLGFPLGAELQSKIWTILKPSAGNGMVADELISQALYQKQKESGVVVTDYIKACEHIHNALPGARSIDSFLSAHSDDEKIAFCGKLAIARIILEHEKENGKLAVEHSQFASYVVRESEFLHSMNDTWFRELGQALMNCNVDELPERLQRFAFIIFNYDRCVEHFLVYLLKISFGVDFDKAATIINENLEIHHPYGTVGDLYWFKSPKYVYAFGQNPNYESLIRASECIQTFSEGHLADDSRLTGIRSCISDAQILVFMGFSYFDINLRLLVPDDKRGSLNANWCIGTAYGESENNKEHVKKFFDKRLRGATRQNIDLVSEMCKGFIPNYAKLLKLW